MKDVLVAGHLGEGLVELLADGLELLLLVAQLICGGREGYGENISIVEKHELYQKSLLDQIQGLQV